MSIDVFSMECDALDGATLVGFKATELLNRPYEVEVFFTVPVGTDVKSAIGARATLTADRDDGRGPMCWHGILASIRLLHETAERGLYRAALVPALWFLRQHVRSFVHTKKKVDAFAADTLTDGGLSTTDFAFHTHAGDYPLEEFVCQYRESHLDFLHRWFEREGLYYYFEHSEGAGAAERMIVVDDKAHHHPLFGQGHVRYFPAAGHDGSAGECFRELSADFELLPASVAISDYNYANPAAPVAGEKGVSQIGRGKIREYGYRVFTEGEAKRLAQIKAQSIACRELVLTASGTYLGLRAGYTFELDEGPSDLPPKYLAIEVRHAGAVSGAAPRVRRYTGLDAKETYRVDVVAIPANVQYRAPQSTPWPRIYGFENGTVDGPADSQYAQIDDQGRYLVRFKFDVSDLPDGSTSTYLRMMQPHGGTSEGWHFPLRKGTEVMVSFQGGDPDRPVIAGVVPNAVQPSNVTSKNFTQNVLRTGGGNYMVMDDVVDGQFIDMSTPVAKTRQFLGKREFVLVTVPPDDPQKAPEDDLIEATYHVTTEGNAVFSVDGAWYQGVGGSYYLDVSGHSTVHYGGKSTFIVDGVSNEHYLSMRHTTIGAGRTDTVKAGGMVQEINGGFLQKVAPAGKQEVAGNWIHQVDSEAWDKYGSWRTSVNGPWNAHFSGAVVMAANGAIQIVSTGGSMKLGATGGSVTIFSPSKISHIAPEVESLAPNELDITGISTAHCVYKHDTAGIATAHTGVKMEATGLKLETTGFYRVEEGTKLEGRAAWIANGALRLFSAGFHKMS